MNLTALHTQLKARTATLETRAQQAAQRLDLARASIKRFEEGAAAARGALENHRATVAELAAAITAEASAPVTPSAPAPSA